MSLSTIYDVRLRYRVDDLATKNVRDIALHTERAGRHSRFLGYMFRRLAFWGGVGGIGLLTKGMVSFNMNMEQARLSIAGLLQMTSKTPFEQNMANATDIVAQLQERARKSTSTTMELVEMLQRTVQPLTAAGLSVKELPEFIHRAAIAAKIFGDEQIAALDIEQALVSNVTIRDRFMKKLLFTIGMSREEFNKLMPAERLKKMQEALNSPALTTLAKKFERSFAGAFTTMKDNLQITLGKVGLPLFQAITDELNSMNTWMQHHPQEIKEWAQSFGEGIKSIFTFVKDVIRLIVDNREILMSAAKAYLGFRVIKGIGGALVGGGLATKAGVGLGLVTQTSATSVALSKFTRNVGLAAGSAWALYQGARGVANLIDRGQDEFNDRVARGRQLFMGIALRGAGVGGDTTLHALAPQFFGDEGVGPGSGLSDIQKRTLLREANESGFWRRRAGTGQADFIKNMFERSRGVFLTDTEATAIASLIRQTSVEQNFGSLPGAASTYLQRAVFSARRGLGTGFRPEGAGMRTAREHETDVALNRTLFSMSDMLDSFTVGNRQIQTQIARDWLSSVEKFANAVGIQSTLFAPLTKAVGPIIDFFKWINKDKKKGKGQTRVQIGRIEVVSDDPDRFAFQFLSTLDDMASNPSNQLSVMRVR